MRTYTDVCTGENMYVHTLKMFFMLMRLAILVNKHIRSYSKFKQLEEEYKYDAASSPTPVNIFTDHSLNIIPSTIQLLLSILNLLNLCRAPRVTSADG
jgi:hypothetical protein